MTCCFFFYDLLIFFGDTETTLVNIKNHHYQTICMEHVELSDCSKFHIAIVLTALKEKKFVKSLANLVGKVHVQSS